ncbi:hypothetical protein B0A55_03526 [Friedmanniomyces simplex]|uniref:Uncharacterized protein n=1 Tax=Friedmanniomyces simplex TaxID=329884 RepID=A0A4U0XF98_9PEZI|nr:hypothetical protein B0A55_03526 [Friedmanniomyces simplex]
MKLRVGGPATLSGPFADIAEARRYLDSIAEALFLEIRNIRDCTGSSKILGSGSGRLACVDAPSTIGMLQISLTKWHARFVIVMKNITPTGRSRQPSNAEVMLQLQHLHLTMVVEGVLSRSEMAYDQHTGTFERMLWLAARILRVNRSSGLAMLPLDSGVITPLFMVALKCRDVMVRRKAISLLELAPEQECMWRREDVLAFAKWKLGKEGQSWRDDASSGGGLRAKAAPLAEAARSHSERGATRFVGGKAVTVLFFKTGDSAVDRSSSFGSEITDLSADMGDVL